MEKICTLSQRLRQALELKDMTQSELARVSGIGKSSISRYVKGDWEGKQDAVYALARGLGVSESWLMGYNVPIGREPETPAEPAKTDALYDIPGILPVPKMVPKPLLGTIACGTPILAVENIAGRILVPEDVPCDFVLRCKGDSMVNAHILDGSLVYVRSQPDVENGEIAAVRIDDEATLKRVYKTPSSITLMPENNKYPPLVYTGEDMNQVQILGLVTAWTNFLG